MEDPALLERGFCFGVWLFLYECGGVLGGFAFDDVVVVGVGHGGVLIVGYFGTGDFAEEDGVGGGFHGVDDFTGYVGDGAFYDRQVVFDFGGLGEFVLVFAAFEAEVAYDKGIALFTEDVDGESLGFLNAFVGVVVVVD